MTAHFEIESRGGRTTAVLGQGAFGVVIRRLSREVSGVGVSFGDGRGASDCAGDVEREVRLWVEPSSEGDSCTVNGCRINSDAGGDG